MHRPVLATIVLACLLGLSLSACGRREPARDGGSASRGTGSSPVARLATPEKVRFTPRVEATGLLKARESTILAFAVAGTLQRVLVERGSRAAAGAPLAALDDAAARAVVAQAEAGLAAAQAQARLAEDALARTARIRAQDGLSDAQLVQAEGQRDLARAQAQAAEATLRQARVSLDRHTLRAPFAGVVTRVPDGTGLAVAAGTPLVTLESTGVLVLETTLTQQEASALRPGDPVEVVVAETGTRAAGAKVRLVLPSADASTGRVPVEVAVPNGDGRLLPHAFARASFPAGPERDAWRVPQASLVQREGAFAAWAAGPDGKARTVPVRVLDAASGDAVVDPGPGGWPEGLQVIAAPPLGIVEGLVVQGPAGAAR